MARLYSSIVAGAAVVLLPMALGFQVPLCTRTQRPSTTVMRADTNSNDFNPLNLIKKAGMALPIAALVPVFGAPIHPASASIYAGDARTEYMVNKVGQPQVQYVDFWDQLLTPQQESAGKQDARAGMDQMKRTMQNPSELKETMKLMADPNARAEVQRMMKDPDFQAEVERMKNSPEMQRAKQIAGQVGGNPAQIAKQAGKQIAGQVASDPLGSLNAIRKQFMR